MGLFNLGNKETEITLKWADLKLEQPVKIRDLWAHTERANTSDQYTATVPGHDVVLLRLSH